MKRCLSREKYCQPTSVSFRCSPLFFMRKRKNTRSPQVHRTNLSEREQKQTAKLQHRASRAYRRKIPFNEIFTLPFVKFDSPKLNSLSTSNDVVDSPRSRSSLLLGRSSSSSLKISSGFSSRGASIDRLETKRVERRANRLERRGATRSSEPTSFVDFRLRPSVSDAIGLVLPF